MRSVVLVLSSWLFVSSLRIQVTTPKEKDKQKKQKVLATPVSPRFPTPGEHVAYVNFIRHAEDCGSSRDSLSDIGFMRAAYLKRCMNQLQRSLVMPFGPPTAIFAVRVGTSFHNTTLRPIRTAEPLAEATGLTLQAPCSRLEDEETLKRFAKCQEPYVMSSLQDKGTVNIFMTKHEMPYLLGRLYAHGHSPSRFHKKKKFLKYPDSTKCRSETQTWPGAYCDTLDPDADPPCSEPKGISCNDAVWQVQFVRANETAPWEAVDAIQLFQEFRGETGEQPCLGDMAPISSDLDLETAKSNRSSSDPEDVDGDVSEEVDTDDGMEIGLDQKHLSRANGEKRCMSCPCHIVEKDDVNPEAVVTSDNPLKKMPKMDKQKGNETRVASVPSQAKIAEKEMKPETRTAGSSENRVNPINPWIQTMWR